MAALRLTPSMKTILSSTMYVEPWHRLQEETGLQAGVLRADLTTMISHGLVDVYQEEEGEATTPFFDADNMHGFHFQSTHKGVKALALARAKEPILGVTSDGNSDSGSSS